MRRLLSLLSVVVAAGWAGCSSDRATWVDGARDFGSTDAGADAGCPGFVCSRDLRSVRDCSGNVVEECGANQACGNGKCIAPCDAAAANEGSVGCSFAVPSPNNEANYGGRGSCFAVFVANNWTTPATLRLDHEGQQRSLDGAVWVPSVVDGVVKHTKLEGPIPPGGGAVVFVSNENTQAPNWVACPPSVEPVFDKELSVYGTGIGRASFIGADVPVSMYAMYPYGGANGHFSSAMLLFPSTSFRKKYVVSSAWGGQSDGFGRGILPNSSVNAVQPGNPTLQIVAVEDETSIDLLPRVDIIGGGGVKPGGRNQIASYRLRRGEVLQLTQDNELVGAIVESNKPVGVFGGHTCLQVPSDVGYCDIENNQLPPVSAWGHQYVIMPAPNREELASRGKGKELDPSPIRFVGAANDTTLTYEPSRPKGAPETLALGELAVFFANEPFVVRSQDGTHPFYAASVMTGSLASSTELGDPEVAMQVPTDQWLDTYGFFADYSYLLSAVYVARRKVDGAFRDVNLDCAGPLTKWRTITPDYEWTYVELTRNRMPQSYPAGTCTDGAHRIWSDGPFSMTQWGLTVAGSYGYPGGTGLRPISDVDVPVR